MQWLLNLSTKSQENAHHRYYCSLFTLRRGSITLFWLCILFEFCGRVFCFWWQAFGSSDYGGVVLIHLLGFGRGKGCTLIPEWKLIPFQCHFFCGAELLYEPCKHLHEEGEINKTKYKWVK